MKVILKNIIDKIIMKKTVKIRIADAKSIYFVEPSEISRVKADSNYSVVYLTNGDKIMVSKTLKEFQNVLEGHGFYRVHHKHLINVRCIAQFARDRFGVIIMEDNVEIELSRRKRSAFLNMMKNLDFVINT